MKCAEFIVDNNVIEFYNSNLGQETILVNGVVASKKRSLLCTRHKFTINAVNYELISSFHLGEVVGIAAELSKNGVMVDKRLPGEKLLHILLGMLILIGAMMVFEILFN